MNRRSIRFLFALILAAAAWWIWNTTSPDSGPIATKFSFGGKAANFMSGEVYRWFMLAFSVALPVLVAWAVGRLPRLTPGLANIPNRQYWLAPERRDEALGYLAGHGLWLGLLMTVFGCALHWLTLKANAKRPPQLDMPLFWLVFAGFLAGVGLWALTLRRRFRKPPAQIRS